MDFSPFSLIIERRLVFQQWEHSRIIMSSYAKIKKYNVYRQPELPHPYPHISTSQAQSFAKPVAVATDNIRSQTTHKSKPLNI